MTRHFVLIASLLTISTLVALASQSPSHSAIAISLTILLGTQSYLDRSSQNDTGAFQKQIDDLKHRLDQISFSKAFNR